MATKHSRPGCPARKVESRVRPLARTAWRQIEAQVDFWVATRFCRKSAAVEWASSIRPGNAAWAGLSR